MKAVTMILAGSAAVAAFAGAAPAAAQYYPNYGNRAPGPYGYNQQALVNQCEGAVLQRLGGDRGGGQVLGVSGVEPGYGGGMTVRGVASSGRYGGGYGGQSAADLAWSCSTDARGEIVGVEVRPAQGGYGYNGYPPNGGAPYGNGYRYPPNGGPPYGYGNGYPRNGEPPEGYDNGYPRNDAGPDGYDNDDPQGEDAPYGYHRY